MRVERALQQELHKTPASFERVAFDILERAEESDAVVVAMAVLNQGRRMVKQEASFRGPLYCGRNNEIGSGSHQTPWPQGGGPPDPTDGVAFSRATSRRSQRGRVGTSR
eukprot:578310-Lingulodinium_polyedra.AAC.1